MIEMRVMIGMRVMGRCSLCTDGLWDCLWGLPLGTASPGSRGFNTESAVLQKQLKDDMPIAIKPNPPYLEYLCIKNH